MKKSSKIIGLLLIFIFIITAFGLHFDFKGVGAAGSDCEHDGDCAHLEDVWNESDTDNYVSDSPYFDDYQPTHGEGVEIWHEYGECSDPPGSLSYDEYGECEQIGPTELQDCSDLNDQYCDSQSGYYDDPEDPGNIEDVDTEIGYYEFYSVSGTDCCEVITEEKMDCRDPVANPADVGGDRSFCTNGSSVYCESFPEALNRDWNEVDHNYDSAIHEPDGEQYPYCGASVPADVTIEWDYYTQTEDDQQAVEITVVDENGYVVRDEDYVSTSTPDVTISGNELGFNTDYNWELRVQDDQGNWSEWYDGEFDTDYRRAAPHFTWSPPQPVAEERVYFEDQTTPGAFSLVSWDWEFKGGADPDSASGQSVTTEFTEEHGTREAILTVEDSDGVVCTASENIEVTPILPDWEEIDPFQ